MPMTGNGLAKLIEECGELIQVAGKKLAYFTTEEHPDGGPLLCQRLEEEIADVQAACQLVTELFALDRQRVLERCIAKHQLFLKWHRKADNNVHGIDSGRPYAPNDP